MRNIERLERRLRLGPDAEARDHARVERAEQLARLIRGEPSAEAWPHLRSLLEELYFRYQRALVAGDDGARGALQVLEDFDTAIGGALQLGRTAFRRMTERRFGTENLLPRTE